MQKKEHDEKEKCRKIIMYIVLLPLCVVCIWVSVCERVCVYVCMQNRSSSGRATPFAQKEITCKKVARIAESNEREWERASESAERKTERELLLRRSWTSHNTHAYIQTSRGRLLYVCACVSAKATQTAITALLLLLLLQRNFDRCVKWIKWSVCTKIKRMWRTRKKRHKKSAKQIEQLLRGHLAATWPVAFNSYIDGIASLLLPCLITGFVVGAEFGQTERKKNAMQARSDLAIEWEGVRNRGSGTTTEQVKPLRKKRSKQESNNFVVSFSFAAVVVLLLS